MWVQMGQYRQIADHQWRVSDKMIYHYQDNDHAIPEGFVCDLATVPWPVNKLIRPAAEGLARPSILHDYYYRIPSQYTRYYIDNLMLDAMRSLDYGIVRRYVIYTGVRLFGWAFWRH